MKKRIVNIALVIALLCTCFAGTYAYLFDTDSATNTMTVGKVTIEQYEFERAKNEDGTYKTKLIDEQTSYVLTDFPQDRPLYPIIGDPHGVPSGRGWPPAGWDAIPVRMSQKDSYGGMQVFAGKNAQDKFVIVGNTGNTSAYVRTLVAIEVNDGDEELIKTSYHTTWKPESGFKAKINDKFYYVYEFVYAGGQLSDDSWRHENGVLPAGDTTYPSLAQVYIKSVATNEDCAALAGTDGKVDILVLSQAVQVEGWDAADGKTVALTALDTAFGDVNEANVAEWFKDLLK